jgi:uncharacterized protein YjbI with pentapeptide repeats
MSGREIQPHEFARIQELHCEWLASDGKAGKRADLRNIVLNEQILGDLGKADLRATRIVGRTVLIKEQGDIAPRGNFEGADLRAACIEDTHLGKSFAHADLGNITWIGACLENANLAQARLLGANLRGANLHGADLTGANLKDACLRDADLTDTRGLLASSLRGADVCNAKLPRAIESFEGLKIVEASSQRAARIFLLLLAACAYAWLTVAATSDVQLITNGGTSKWPIIETEVPIVWFFWTAPAVLQRMWESLADLPAIFPDGRPLDKHTYPWLMNDLVRDDFSLLKSNRPALSGIQRVISIFLCWWIMPLTLLVFWLRYARRHDYLGTAFHVLLFGLTVWAALTFYCLSRATLRGDDSMIECWKHPWRYAATYTRGLVGITAAAILGVLSYGAIQGVPASNTIGEPNLLQTRIPTILDMLHFSAFADLALADVSIKPPTWTGLEERREEELVQVKAPRLGVVNVRFAEGSGAFLAKMAASYADFTGANFKNANFQGADLFNAYFSYAKLDGADFRKAALNRANLNRAFLKSADLRGAQLKEAHLEYAILYDAKAQNAEMQGADFSNAQLNGADLRGANLFGAKITQEQVSSAITDEETKLPLFTTDRADSAVPGQPPQKKVR